ncbi:hypothetical protein KQX54_008794 [Cotesia glomerata]|uniref:Uncharacterized protein n=1 Tax=Cotesia glomerata TaxID=32391 RepID=A0AAV7HX55_COTGL|nr:hypothetical protein KQX54_008794 [Cotesia glomerata]
MNIWYRIWALNEHFRTWLSLAMHERFLPEFGSVHLYSRAIGFVGGDERKRLYSDGAGPRAGSRKCIHCRSEMGIKRRVKGMCDRENGKSRSIRDEEEMWAFSATQDPLCVNVLKHKMLHS